MTTKACIELNILKKAEIKGEDTNNQPPQFKNFIVYGLRFLNTTYWRVSQHYVVCQFKYTDYL
jgi:hypothetical protein